MSDEPERERTEPPFLDYQPPEIISRASKAKAISGGATTGALAIMVVGAVLAALDIGPARRPALPQIVFFLTLALVTVLGTIYMRRLEPRTPRRWFWLAALIGAGVMSLIEGLCFASF